jgi:hypothetical protein
MRWLCARVWDDESCWASGALAAPPVFPLIAAQAVRQTQRCACFRWLPACAGMRGWRGGRAVDDSVVWRRAGWPLAAAGSGSLGMSRVQRGRTSGVTSVWHSQTGLARRRRMRRIPKVAATRDTHIANRRSNAASKGWLNAGTPLPCAIVRACVMGGTVRLSTTQPDIFFPEPNGRPPFETHCGGKSDVPSSVVGSRRRPKRAAGLSWDDGAA